MLLSWIQELQQQWQQTSLAEAVAVFFAVLSVLFSYKNKVWVYPTGIISTAIYSWLMAQSHHKLYAEAVLNVYYTVMSIYGWYHWLNGRSHQQLRISHAQKSDQVTAFAIAIIGWLVFAFLLSQFTDSDVALFDAFVSATACAGMWLLAKRKIENWLWLNVSNLVAIPLLVHKHLILTACLTLFLFFMAVMGYFNWKKIYKSEAISN